MKRLLCILPLLLWCVSVQAAVAVDATYSGRDATFNSGTSISAPGMTVGASATCLVVGIAWGASVSGVSVTWNGTAMTAAAVEAQTGATSGWYYLNNPASGNKTIGASWTGSADGYVTAVSWTGTSTTACVNTADDVTVTTTTVTINSATNDATAALCNWGSSNCTPSDFTTIFSGNQKTNFAAASYALGGTSNSHTFGGSSSSGAGIHIVASSGGGPTCGQSIAMMGVGCR